MKRPAPLKTYPDVLRTLFGEESVILQCLSRYLWAGIATGWTVRGSSPSWARFSAPFQSGPGDHPVSYTIVTGSFPEIKRPGRGADRPLPNRAEVKEGIELYLSSPSRSSWPFLV